MFPLTILLTDTAYVVMEALQSRNVFHEGRNKSSCDGRITHCWCHFCSVAGGSIALFPICSHDDDQHVRKEWVRWILFWRRATIILVAAHSVMLLLLIHASLLWCMCQPWVLLCEKVVFQSTSVAWNCSAVLSLFHSICGVPERDDDDEEEETCKWHVPS